MLLADKVLQHFLGVGEVGDDAVFHRPLGGNVFRRTTQHFLGVGADRLDRLGSAGAAILANGNNRRLVEYNSLTARIN